MKETTYVEILDTVLAIEKVARREILDGLFGGLASEIQERLKGDLWSWTCDAPPAFDLALGDENDVIKAALELKSPGTNVNYTSLGTARTYSSSPDDDLAQRIFREVVDSVDPAFDVPHPYVDATCAHHAHTGSGAAGIHQGDLYRACLPGVTNMKRPGHLGEVTYLFIGPSDKAWRDGLVSEKEWHTILLPEVLPRWQETARRYPHVAVLVEATRRFLAPP